METLLKAIHERFSVNGWSWKLKKLEPANGHGFFCVGTLEAGQVQKDGVGQAKTAEEAELLALRAAALKWGIGGVTSVLQESPTYSSKEAAQEAPDHKSAVQESQKVITGEDGEQDTRRRSWDRLCIRAKELTIDTTVTHWARACTTFLLEKGYIHEDMRPDLLKPQRQWDGRVMDYLLKSIEWYVQQGSRDGKLPNQVELQNGAKKPV